MPSDIVSQSLIEILDHFSIHALHTASVCNTTERSYSSCNHSFLIGIFRCGFCYDSVAVETGLGEDSCAVRCICEGNDTTLFREISEDLLC